MLTRLVDRGWAAAEWRLRSAYHETRRLPVRVRAWRAFQSSRQHYTILDEQAVRRTRKSDTIFIFGSGWSLNQISAAEWERIAAHDTLGFNWFVRQAFVRVDYQLVREITGDDLDSSQWRADLAEYFDLVCRNPQFADTIFLVQSGFRALNGNRALGYRYLPASHRVFLWRSVNGRSEPTLSLSEGLAHRHGTLNECVNFAMLLGWRHIVIAGVDLYDRRYFWLPRDEPRSGDATVEGMHNTAKAGLVEGLGRWRELLEARGHHLYCYNPRSLLVPTLPVWTWANATQGRA
jgi:hypothetical protein